MHNMISFHEIFLTKPIAFHFVKSKREFLSYLNVWDAILKWLVYYFSLNYSKKKPIWKISINWIIQGLAGVVYMSHDVQVTGAQRLPYDCCPIFFFLFFASFIPFSDFWAKSLSFTVWQRQNDFSFCITR